MHARAVERNTKLQANWMRRRPKSDSSKRNASSGIAGPANAPISHRQWLRRCHRNCCRKVFMERACGFICYWRSFSYGGLFCRPDSQPRCAGITLGKAVAGVLVVDRYSAYKAMRQVKLGQLLLAFCWAHVRRDFVRIGKGYPELKDWALAWLLRIRELYCLNRERLRHAPGASERVAAEGHSGWHFFRCQHGGQCS